MDRHRRGARRRLRTARIVAAPLQEMLALEGDVGGVHDPVVIKEGGTYYVFVTGGRAAGHHPDQDVDRPPPLAERRAIVMPALPEWATREIPQARNAWAPDISFWNGKFHLYYSVSSFGSRNSAIGLATTRTLDPASADYRWDGRGHGAAVLRREGRLERDRPEPGDRGRQERLAHLGQLLGRDQDAPRRSGHGQALRHGHDDACPEQPGA